jgi:segregation and condensation protein A
MSAENPSEAVSEAESSDVEDVASNASENGDEPSPAPAGKKERRRVSEAVPAASAESAEAAAAGAGYRVNLPMFEGPLDLLLHLVQKHELDILDIPISFITEKYTQYIRMLDGLNIDLASEYLVMAATLVHIKSRMLLPNAPADEEDEADAEELDPRADLVRRLLEYQKYKNAAEALAQRSITGKDVFPRGSSLESVGGQLPLVAVSMFQLIDVFQSVLERTAQTRQHEIDFERFSISEKISELLERLRGEGRMAFESIFSGDRSRGEIIVTFLALLEMTRLRLTWLFQDGPLEPIYVELRVTDEEAAETNVEASDASFAPPAPRHALEQEPFAALDDEAELDDEADLDAELLALELEQAEVEQAEVEAEAHALEPEPMEAEVLALELEQAEVEAEAHALEPEPVEGEAHALEPVEADQDVPKAIINDTGVEQT